MVCMVRVLPPEAEGPNTDGDAGSAKAAPGRFVPACTAPAEDGMRVESETDAVHAVRREALELLLTEHLGDCLAPCWFGCPANMDIPLMLRQIAAGDFAAAIATVKRDIALPAVLGHICPAPCERVCRRGQTDGAVTICLLKRFVADVDLTQGDPATGKPYLPECAPDSGKRVAVVGAGASGLSAAYYLQQLGHQCTIFEQSDQPGGRMLKETTPEQLPREVLRAEIDTLLATGIELRCGMRVDETTAASGSDAGVTDSGVTDSGVTAGELRQPFDAVLYTFGAEGGKGEGGKGRWTADESTGEFRLKTSTNRTLVIRSAADGKEVATAIDQYLGGRPIAGPEKPFNTKMGRLDAEELAAFVTVAGDAPRRMPAERSADNTHDEAITGAAESQPGYAPEEAIAQADRCLHCDCRALGDCRLRQWSARYGANPRRHGPSERRFSWDHSHPDVVYEPGKCIACGLCIEIARRAGEPLGLTFVGRGFEVRVAAPLEGTMREALQRAAAECVEACPTAALAWRG